MFDAAPVALSGAVDLGAGGHSWQSPVELVSDVTSRSSSKTGRLLRSPMQQHGPVQLESEPPHLEYAWRGAFTNREVNALHAEAFETRLFGDDEWDWQGLTERHSLGWITARTGMTLVGFVNVLWDGLVHAWLQDTMVAASARRRGIGVGLVAAARVEAAGAGCEVLHVDFDDVLRSFYFDACGFHPTNGGLLDLIEYQRATR